MLRPRRWARVARRRWGNRWRGSGTRGWRSLSSPSPSSPRTFRTFARDTRERTPRTARGLALVASASAAVAGVAGAATGYLPPPSPRASRRRRHASRLGRVPFAALALVAPAVALARRRHVTFVLISERLASPGANRGPSNCRRRRGVRRRARRPALVSAARRRSRRARDDSRDGSFFVAVTWTVAAAFASLAVASPYSARAPKRLAVLTNTAGATGGDAARFFVGAFDSVPAAAALAPLQRAAAIRPTTREDFASMHPVTQLLGEGIVLRARDAGRPPWGAEGAPSGAYSPRRTPDPSGRRRLRGRVRGVATGGDVQIARRRGAARGYGGA